MNEGEGNIRYLSFKNEIPMIRKNENLDFDVGGLEQRQRQPTTRRRSGGKFS